MSELRKKVEKLKTLSPYSHSPDLRFEWQLLLNEILEGILLSLGSVPEDKEKSKEE